VRALAEGQALASGRPASVGANGRLGNVGDGNIIQEVLGIPTVQYDPEPWLKINDPEARLRQGLMEL